MHCLCWISCKRRRTCTERCERFIPANRVQDDIVIFADESRERILTGCHLRQQTEKPKGANYCLSDFVGITDSQKADYIGAFAVTAGITEDAIAKVYEDAGDDYNAIMVKAVCDRLAEAFAEFLREKVRKETWNKCNRSVEQ